MCVEIANTRKYVMSDSNEINCNTAIRLTTKGLLKLGLDNIIDPIMSSLKIEISKQLIDVICANLSHEGSNYQFILTVKKLDNKNA